MKTFRTLDREGAVFQLQEERKVPRSFKARISKPILISAYKNIPIIDLLFSSIKVFLWCQTMLMSQYFYYIQIY